MNSLERQLRSWRPRRPSPTLEWWLFLSPARLAAQTARLVGGLAPVTACVWLAILSLNSGNAVFSANGTTPLAAMTSSNQSCFFGASGFEERGQNAPRPAILKWTNAGNSTFIGTFTPFRTITD